MKAALEFLLAFSQLDFRRKYFRKEACGLLNYYRQNREL